MHASVVTGHTPALFPWLKTLKAFINVMLGVRLRNESSYKRLFKASYSRDPKSGFETNNCLREHSS